MIGIAGSRCLAFCKHLALIAPGCHPLKSWSRSPSLFSACSILSRDCSRPRAASESKMPGRDRGPGDRDPDRLVDRLRGATGALHDRAQRRLDRRRVEAIRSAERLEGVDKRAARTSGVITFSQAAASSAGPANRNRINGQTSSSVWALSWTISHAARRRSGVGGSEGLGVPLGAPTAGGRPVAPRTPRAAALA